MNSPIAFLTPPGKSEPTSAKFPAKRNASAAPFSSVLERAAFQAPDRHHSNAKPGRIHSENTTEVREETARHDRRPPVRAKGKREAAPDEQSLAGAAAVNGQPVKAEENSQAESAGVASSPDEMQATTSTSLGQKPAAGAESKTATAADLELVATGAEATEAAASLLNGPVAPEGTADLAELIKSASPTNPAAIVKAATPTMAIETLPATAESAAPTDEAVALQGTPTATSAREAEIILANSAESDTAVESELTPALMDEAAMTAVAPDEARRAVRAARQNWNESRDIARGIGAAKSLETMKTAINQEEIAGVAQQILPSTAAAPVATLPSLPTETRLGSGAPIDALHMAAKLSPAPTRADISGLGEQLDLRPATPITRISEVISREVRMFKRGGDDLVEVVLTPDARTQISLRVQWREGQVEVQARCDLGDHHSLNQQWPQLQASMAQHGVRLSHLSERVTTGFTDFFQNPNFSQQQGGERRTMSPATSAATTAPTGSQTGKQNPTKSGIRSNRLLESWA